MLFLDGQEYTWFGSQVKPPGCASVSYKEKKVTEQLVITIDVVVKTPDPRSYSMPWFNMCIFCYTINLFVKLLNLFFN